MQKKSKFCNEVHVKLLLKVCKLFLFIPGQMKVGLRKEP